MVYSIIRGWEQAITAVDITKKGDAEAFDAIVPVAKLKSPTVLADILCLSRDRGVADVDKDTAQAVAAHLRILKTLIDTFRTDLPDGARKKLFAQQARALSSDALRQLKESAVLSQDLYAIVERIPANIAEHMLETWGSSV
jgi:hypothetical protein